jgi:hypothetical protein
MAEKEVDGQKEEEDMVKRKNDWYLLDHHVPVHSNEVSGEYKEPKPS